MKQPDQLTQDLAMIGRNAIDALISADKKREDADEVKAQCRALKIADWASFDMVQNHGQKYAGIESYVFDPDVLASNEELEEAIEHLVWRGLATKLKKSDEVEIMLHD